MREQQYRVYRALRGVNLEGVDMNQLGISWAASESYAHDFGRQFGGKYVVVSALVTEEQINIAQTNAQWNDDEHAGEGEVVLHEFEDIQVEGLTGNTGPVNINDETRPDPEECEPSRVLNFLEMA